MRSLFLRIFLWFWLAITIVIGGLATVTWLYPEQTVPIARLPEALHELQVRGAFAVYGTDGLEAFTTHCAELDRASGITTYFILDDGTDLRGVDIPESVTATLNTSAAALTTNDVVTLTDPARLLIALRTPDARQITAVAIGRTRPRLFRSPPPPDRTPRTDVTGAPRPEHRRGPPPRPPQSSAFELLVPMNLMLLRLAAVILTAGVGCYLLARSLTAPLRALQSSVRRFAGGELSVRVDERIRARGDEIGALAREFDRMSQQIDELVSTQRDLLRNLSHELRSPLTRLGLALDLAAQHAGPDAHDALERATREAGRLNVMIREILTIARLERDAAVPAHADFDLTELLRHTVDDATFEAHATGRNVALTVPDERVILHGSIELMRSAIENILRNAVRYTADDTTVTVALTTSSDDHVTITIRDHGPGVPDAELSQLFEPFHRVSHAEATHEGTGLGLTIAERAVTLHDGVIEARNAPGGGLEIVITLRRVGT